MRTSLPWRFRALTTTDSWRSTSPTQPGLLKHPSSPTWLPAALTMTGFTRPQIWFSSPFTTHTRSATPIWLAASPAPGASSMVSTRSSRSRWMDVSTRGTFRAFWRRTGCSTVRSGRTTSGILPRVGLRLRQPARIAHDKPAFQLVVTAVRLDAGWAQAVEGPSLPHSARVPADGNGEPVGKLRPFARRHHSHDIGVDHDHVRWSPGREPHF